MKTKYPNIFEPLTVKRTTIRNRIAMTPMGTNYGEANGEMSNRHMNYYSLRAKGWSWSYHIRKCKRRISGWIKWYKPDPY